MEKVAKYTGIYTKSIAKLLSEPERIKIENEVLERPKAHPVIPGTGGIRKARFSSHGKGKRGGARLCYYYLQLHETVYFLTAYAKNKQTDLSADQKKYLSEIVQQIKTLTEKERV